MADRGASEPACGELAGKTPAGVRGPPQQPQGHYPCAHPFRAREQTCPGFPIQDSSGREAGAGEDLRMKKKKGAVGEVDANHLSGGSLELH
jgi:hypothetical protein